MVGKKTKAAAGVVAGVTGLTIAILAPITIPIGLAVAAVGYMGKKAHKKYKQKKRKQDEQFYASLHNNEPDYAPQWDTQLQETNADFAYSSNKQGYAFDD